MESGGSEAEPNLKSYAGQGFVRSWGIKSLRVRPLGRTAWVQEFAISSFQPRTRLTLHKLAQANQDPFKP